MPFFSWLRAPQAEDYRRSVCDALKACTQDSTPPRQVFSDPERDELKPCCVHIYTDNDLLALALKREQEQKAQPRNVRAFIRTVNS